MPDTNHLASSGDSYEPSSSARCFDEPTASESIAWQYVKVGGRIAMALSILSAFMGSVIFAAIAVTLALAPIVFLLKLFRDNVGRVHGATAIRIITALFISMLYSLPIMPILLPAIAVNYVGDLVLDRGIAVTDERLGAVDTKWMEVSQREPYPWYSPWRWLGYNKVENVVRSFAVPRYTGLARLAIKVLRDFLVILQVYWWVFLIYFVVRTFGYVTSRMINRFGMKLELAFPA